jgi:hypothetical protein
MLLAFLIQKGHFTSIFPNGKLYQLSLASIIRAATYKSIIPSACIRMDWVAPSWPEDMQA